MSIHSIRATGVGLEGAIFRSHGFGARAARKQQVLVILFAVYLDNWRCHFGLHFELVVVVIHIT